MRGLDWKDASNPRGVAGGHAFMLSPEKAWICGSHLSVADMRRLRDWLDANLPQPRPEVDDA